VVVLAIIKTDILGSVNVGNYVKATNSYLIITGETTDKKSQEISEVLGVEYVKVMMKDCRITAPFFAGNSRGLLISKFIDDETVSLLREQLKGIQVEVVQDKFTAIGNLILPNDKGALVSPLLSPETIKSVADVLDLEVAPGNLCLAPYVGSLAVVNNQGGLVTPYARDEEIKGMEELLGVEVMRGTINSGISFIASGLLANDRGAIAGKITDGIELMRISQALKVM
jgi:translation initiation factor 6